MVSVCRKWCDSEYYYFVFYYEIIVAVIIEIIEDLNAKKYTELYVRYFPFVVPKYEKGGVSFFLRDGTKSFLPCLVTNVFRTSGPKRLICTCCIP